jgi:hypothetical protein
VLPPQENPRWTLLSGDCFAARDSLLCRTRTSSHVHSLFGTHASLSTEQARSKQGPTLRVSYVVSPIITSRPLRHPSAHHSDLVGFIRLDPDLPPMEYGGDGRTSGPFLRPLSPHAAGLTPGPLQVHLPFTSLQTLAFPLNVEGRRVSCSHRFIPQPDSPSYTRPALCHEAAPFALCCGLRIRPTPLTGLRLAPC